MGIEEMASMVGRVVVAHLEGENVNELAGKLVSVSKSWAHEYTLRFVGGDSVVMLEGDTLTVDGARHTLA